MCYDELIKMKGTNKMTPAKLRNEITNALKRLGYKIADKENTAGAKKVWMSLVGSEVNNLKELITLLRIVLPTESARIYEDVDGFSIRGNRFELIPQGKKSIFIACYNNSYAGLEYEMGVDC